LVILAEESVFFETRVSIRLGSAWRGKLKTARKVVLESDMLVADLLALDRQAERLVSDIDETGAEQVEKQKAIEEIKFRQKQMLARLRDLRIEFWRTL
jgi:hypothetical protein